MNFSFRFICNRA